MRKLLDAARSTLDRTSRGPLLALVVAAFAVLLYLISFAPDVPFSAERIKTISGGQGVLDLEFAYSPAEGAQALDRLGEQARRHYDYFQIADIFFPLSYAVGLGSLILALYRRWSFAPALALVPVVGAAFDYLENIGVFVALRTFPDPSRPALALASAAGSVKMVGSYVSQGLVLVGLVLWLVSRLRGRAGRRS